MADKTQQQAMEEQKANCPFCRIVSGEFPSKKVYEDDKIIAVLDINPAVKGHTLVLPKEHYPFVGMIPEDIFKHLFEKSAEIAKCIEESMLCQGIEWFIASGSAAGQQVPHFILHLIPREQGDSLDIFDLKEGAVSEEELRQIRPNIEDKFMFALGKKLPEKISKEKLMEIIEKSPKLKETMIEQPEEFKKMVESTLQLKALFKGFDLDEVINDLKSGKKPKKTKDEKAAEKAVKKEAKAEKKKKSDLDSISKLFE